MLELPRNPVRTRNRVRSSSHQPASTEEQPYIASQTWISFLTPNSARTVSKTIEVSIGQWDGNCIPPVVAPRLTDRELGRLSHRLQRNDRAVVSTPFHPYSRPTPSPKKSASRSQLPMLNPPTLSSSTLNSSLFSNSAATKQPRLRRSFSFLLSSSNPASLYTDNPWVQRIRRADSFVASVTNNSLKRAPSFCNNSNRSSFSDTMNVNGNAAKVVPATSQHSENQPTRD